MISFLTLSPLFGKLLSTGIVQRIYYDVTLEKIATGTVPVYPSGGDDLENIGQDDRQKMGCYLRQTGDAVNNKTEFVHSDQKSYRVRVPYRMVFFNDYEERNADDLQALIMQLMFDYNIEFSKMVTDKSNLVSQEGEIVGFKFGKQTFYCAIDFNAFFTLYKTNCAVQIGCKSLPNPLQPCDIAALETLSITEA